MRKLKNPVQETRHAEILDVRLVIPVQARVIDVVNVEHFVSPLDGSELMSIPNDISLAVSQQKLASFNPEIVKSIISEYSRSSSTLSQALKNIPDDTIMSSIKSRYIQSPADMSMYLRCLQNAVRDELDSIAVQVEKSKSQSSTVNVESSSE